MTHLSRLKKRLCESGYALDGTGRDITTRSGIANFIIIEAPLECREGLDDFLTRFSYPSKVRKMSSGSLQFIIKL